MFWYFINVLLDSSFCNIQKVCYNATKIGKKVQLSVLKKPLNIFLHGKVAYKVKQVSSLSPRTTKSLKGTISSLTLLLYILLIIIYTPLIIHLKMQMKKPRKMLPYKRKS
jgi:hypothetical protein